MWFLWLAWCWYVIWYVIDVILGLLALPTSLAMGCQWCWGCWHIGNSIGNQLGLTILAINSASPHLLPTRLPILWWSVTTTASLLLAYSRWRPFHAIHSGLLADSTSWRHWPRGAMDLANHPYELMTLLNRKIPCFANLQNKIGYRCQIFTFVE